MCDVPFMHNLPTECALQRYGPRCSKNCSDHCIDRDCDPRDGKCRTRCEDGYQGDTCDESKVALLVAFSKF